MSQFPFSREFSAERQQAIVKMLGMRASLLTEILAKGGTP
jgi:hypothetical protein